MKKSALFAFCVLGGIWGSNFIFMKWATEVVTPAQVTLARVVCGFVPIAIYAAFTRAIRWSDLRHAHHFFVMSLLATFLDYFTYAQGVARLSSGIAGTLSGTIPLFAVVCSAFLHGRKELDVWKVMGVVIGFLGVLLIAHPWSVADGSIDMTGVCWMLGGSCSMALSFIYARRYLTPLKIPGVALTTYQVGFAALYLAVFTPFDGMSALLMHPHAAVGLIIGLGLLGTGIAYLAYYHVVEHLGALAASSVTYIPPVVALFIGAIIVGEPTTASDYVSVVLIMVGVGVMQFGKSIQRVMSSKTQRVV
ncbi:multidrug DMT transporter permease [Caballeronia hypogeia]|uniref:Multidrug DMT transporter permease n=1 Tax=Caballeronia hypogeia TaxID=1777140 RepID=A0A158DFI8_9BURK|nr:DMT family transporter [Caballeronia hypogeia]SAK93412.1 multidrug DMT transporter permease [Caballeronia hypogeia]